LAHRSEAKGVPHILVGPIQTAHSEEANGYVDENDEAGGYYEDGAFIAAPESTSRLSASTSAAPDAQEAYYISLTSRFRELHTQLQHVPPLSAVEALTSDHPISLPPESAKAKQLWRFLLQSQEPQMAQLACMDMESVLEVVKLIKSLLAGTMRSRSQERIQRLGAWIWGVLGRCSEAGQLGSEEISELRELGKRAVGLLVGIRDRSGKTYGQEEDDQEEVEYREDVATTESPDPQAEPTAGGKIAQHDSAEPDLSAGTSSESKELEDAKAALQQQLSVEYELSPSDELEEGQVEEEGGNETVKLTIDKQVRVILDMVITVVGDLYGQRDLLEFRDIWDDEQLSLSEMTTTGDI
jgi:regulator of vacuolar morphogenesis